MIQAKAPPFQSGGAFCYTEITMANKQKKKRNKAYRGVDAAIEKPVVTRITAVNRSKPAQWWYDNKRVAKPVLIISAIVFAIIWLIAELIRIAAGA